MSSERRQFPRVKTAFPINYINTQQFFLDYAENLSMGGVFIASNNILPVGTELELSLSLPGLPEPIKTTGRVVRVVVLENSDNGEFQPGMGIQFDELPLEGKSSIAKLLSV